MPPTSLALTLSHAVDVALDRTVAPGFTKVGSSIRRRLPGWPADAAPGALVGQHAVVTGASSGLGIATARGYAALGATVHLTVRNAAKGEQVRQQLQAEFPHADLRLGNCDVSDLDSVRSFTAALCQELAGEPLTVLAHNAGAMPPTRSESAQGHEQTMALHVLGPLLMTELLLPVLRPVNQGGARIILVTSGGMYGQKLISEDPEYLTGTYSGVTAYARSKRAQVELLDILARRWSGHVVAAMHPGWADTPGVVESLPTFHRLTGPFLRDSDDGADTTVWLGASTPTPPSGLFWHDRQPRPTHLTRRTRTGAQERQELWRWCQDAVAELREVGV